ncbi:Dolichol kinase sec59 [Paramyrothecium foliicola]|nr:Dolichol kinase sec59 [Paramyrothecium foliicola]
MLEPPSTEHQNGGEPDDRDAPPILSRSPHPYHHQSSELPSLSDHFSLSAASTFSSRVSGDGKPSQTRLSSFSKDSSQTSDSGTEADDEHFLKGLPAPRVRLHKGLRGQNEPLSGSSTPLQSPDLPEDDGPAVGAKPPLTPPPSSRRRIAAVLRKHKVLVRRLTEVALMGALGCMVWSNPQVSPLTRFLARDFRHLGLVYAALIVFYPVSILAWARRHQRPFEYIPFSITSNFDPAPLLYPPTITLLVSLLVSINNPTVILPNIILTICAAPPALIPHIDPFAPYNVSHWVLSCLPLTWPVARMVYKGADSGPAFLPGETLVLLYPLHATLCNVLHYLTTTSLLTAELQLLSVALINTLILASSPQVQILKSLLWGGGLSILIFCGPIIRWGITLARVPKWRFQKATVPRKHQFWALLARASPWRNAKLEFMASTSDQTMSEISCSSDEENLSLFNGPPKVRTFGPTSVFPAKTEFDATNTSKSFLLDENTQMQGIGRRHTLPFLDKAPKRNASHTPSGRRKRAVSVSVRPFLKLTYGQALMRKWAYAAYVYISIILIVLVGIRAYIEKFALHGNEPIGWALGYFFGNLPWFRFKVVMANLERWICLPPRSLEEEQAYCSLGWVEHVRHSDFGEANMRLFISAYWVVILITGLTIVFQLKNTVEVDTRRKVFHFMMVGMFLPATFIDPTFAALALSIVLAIFLFLDLMRASQLPPLSKPIASFLAPYVDGRDFRGPVVISHIFLLIGCAIPLWLALASLPRTGTGFATGWEVPTREASMVSGVVCVGLGDAAASLIGRRFGRHKWLWGGGKSLEGSVAFAAAVFFGLMAANAWLRVGGWPATGGQASVLTSVRNAGVCGSMASLTEAVLTGGNDNVIVPVVLWTCVKSLGA